MSDRNGIFAGEDPFAIARAWLSEAEASEPNDPNAIALASVDAEGLPNVRMVLLKEIKLLQQVKIWTLCQEKLFWEVMRRDKRLFTA